MDVDILVKVFEHNNWANSRMIQVCSSLTDEQLDAAPHSATKGTIRETVIHLVASQRGYLKLLTLPVEERLHPTPLAFADLHESARASGEGLLTLARDLPGSLREGRLQTTDGYSVEPWVVFLQAINHATEHREQINSMLTALGVTPPDLDGWTYGEVTQALTPIS